MISPRQTRAARALLGWTQQDLADRAVVATNTVARFEAGAVDPRSSTLASIRRALARAGIEFLDDDSHAEGVRLKNKT